MKTAGYLNDVLNVLDANTHPCIIMGRFALEVNHLVAYISSDSSLHFVAS